MQEDNTNLNTAPICRDKFQPRNVIPTTIAPHWRRCTGIRFRVHPVFKPTKAQIEERHTFAIEKVLPRNKLARLRRRNLARQDSQECKCVHRDVAQRSWKFVEQTRVVPSKAGSVEKCCEGSLRDGFGCLLGTGA